MARSMREIPYELCDVFTDRPLAGNALAVFTDADDIDGATMQALARETNLSGVRFCPPSSQRGGDCGNPHLHADDGAPLCRSPDAGNRLRARRASPASDAISLETGRGIVTVRLSHAAGRAGFGWMTQPLPAHRALPCGRQAGDRARRGGLEACPWSSTTTVPTTSLSSLDTRWRSRGAHGPTSRASPPSAAPPSASLLEKVRAWKCRVFAPGEGIAEDPATGAAAGPLAVHLARHDRIAFGDEIVIEQGVEIGRPSTLHARARGSRDRLESVEVGGHAVLVGQGTFRLP